MAKINKKNILITGASGMLGATLVQRLQKSHNVFATGRLQFQDNPAKLFMEFDLTSESYDMLLNWSNPEMIIHCAAITNVDYCENNPEEAVVINAESVQKFFKCRPNVKIIFISSDAVFPDGIHMANEKDQILPGNIYGKTKETGENYINDNLGSHLTIRTTIIGKNINPNSSSFVEWIVKSVREGKEINLFEDVIFTPISIWDFADELEWIIDHDLIGLFHIVGKDCINKYKFGYEICNRLDLNTKLLKKSCIENRNFIARRSKDQTLDSSCYQRFTNRKLPSIEQTIESVVRHFNQKVMKD